MSIKSKVLATAATLALVGGVGTAGVLGSAGAANAATPSCGKACVDIFSQEYGHHHDPTFLLDVFQQHAKVGQPIILFRQSNADPAEDFQAQDQGTVADFYAAALVDSEFALHYGCIAGTPAFPDCFGLVRVPLGSPFTYGGLCTDTNLTWVWNDPTDHELGGTCLAEFNDPAFVIEYAPNGQQSGLCLGLAKTAYQEEGVTLQTCGASNTTVWAVDLYDNVFQSFFLGYAPLINGSDDNFSEPFVLTYPQSGYPTDKPRPELQVDNLSGYTTGIPPISNYSSIDDNQMWGADFGPWAFES
jgi:hypothetical protein